MNDDKLKLFTKKPGDSNWVLNELLQRREEIAHIVVTVEFKGGYTATIASEMSVGHRIAISYVEKRNLDNWFDDSTSGPEERPAS